MTDDATFDAAIDLLRKYQEAYPVYVLKRDGSFQRFGQPRDPAAVDRALTLSAAHRLISKLAETTNSRSELDECLDVMSQLGRMVDDA